MISSNILIVNKHVFILLSLVFSTLYKEKPLINLIKYNLVNIQPELNYIVIVLFDSLNKLGWN